MQDSFNENSAAKDKEYLFAFIQEYYALGVQYVPIVLV